MAVTVRGNQAQQRIQTIKRKREDYDTVSFKDAEIILSGVENTGRRQKYLGLGDPAGSIERTKRALRSTIYMAHANELSKLFQPVEPPDPKYFPRAEKFSDRFPKPPEIVICQLGPGVTHARCSAGHSTSIWGARNYEAPIPVIPNTVIELASRAKKICPDIEFHLLFRPAWEEAPQEDPVLLGRVPEINEYFEIGWWDGDAALIKEFLTEIQ